jgi:hypothetical protein
MKAYLFNEENGLYEGEIYEEADKLAYDDGITTIPPPAYDHGDVPVFDLERKVWTVAPVKIVLQLLSHRVQRS